MSMNSSALLGRTKNASAVIERDIDETLKDRSLIHKRTEKNLNVSVNNPSVRHWLNRTGKKDVQNTTDVTASAILPRLSTSLAMHSDKGLQYAEQKIEGMIKECNDTAYKKCLPPYYWI